MFNWRLKVLLSISLSAVIFTACGDAPKSKEYFLAHPDEIEPTLALCAQKTGQPNCQAASEAQNQIKRKKRNGTFKPLPKPGDPGYGGL